MLGSVIRHNKTIIFYLIPIAAYIVIETICEVGLGTVGVQRLGSPLSMGATGRTSVARFPRPAHQAVCFRDISGTFPDVFGTFWGEYGSFGGRFSPQNVWIEPRLRGFPGTIARHLRIQPTCDDETTSVNDELHVQFHWLDFGMVSPIEQTA